MPNLYATQGLPGAGKTTYAQGWVDMSLGTRARVSRDDLGAMLHGSRTHQPGPTEQAITAAQHGTIVALLHDNFDVIVDDTNLDQKVLDDLRYLGSTYGAGFTIIDMTDVPLELCLMRNQMRDPSRRVPAGEIQRLHAEYIATIAV